MAFLNWNMNRYKSREKKILPAPYSTRGMALPSFRSETAASSQQETILEIESISLSIGGLNVLSNVSINIYSRLTHAVIGPNGAGKTSLLNCISQVYEYQKGVIRMSGTTLDGLRPDQVAQLGIARTFQQTELFAHMSVMDTLLLGRHFFMKGGILRAGFWLPSSVKDEITNRIMAEEIIEFLNLEAYRDTLVGLLPYGIQKRVDVGRALAMNPRILLLDEPCAGMNMEETEDMARFILDIKEELGLTIVIIEHNMQVIMDISDRVSVLNFGSKIAEGKPEEVEKDPLVIEAYLGSMEQVK